MRFLTFLAPLLIAVASQASELSKLILPGKTFGADWDLTQSNLLGNAAAPSYINRKLPHQPVVMVNIIRFKTPEAARTQWEKTRRAEADEDQARVRTIDGYRGIWFDLGQRTGFGSKYSGGLGTYTAKHHPLAVYAPAAEKTFFVYGGTSRSDARHLLAMMSFYDHRTKQVSRPVVVHDKQGVDDPHDNPSIQIDGAGHLWVYVSGRGSRRPGHVYRSRLPYDIESFEHVGEREFTYPQPWWIDEKGFVFLFTKYKGTHRELFWSASDASGGNWTEDRKLAGMGGHYQVSNEQRGRIITAFNMHPGGKVARSISIGTPTAVTNAAVVVAHPDDEILSSGGLILSHPEWRWWIVTLCCASDSDRAAKFRRVLEFLGAGSEMADLDDGPGQEPLDIEQLGQTVQRVLHGSLKTKGRDLPIGG